MLFDIPILDDSTLEDVETFTATLFSSEPNVMIAEGGETATISIIDTDSKSPCCFIMAIIDPCSIVITLNFTKNPNAVCSYVYG